MSQQLWKRMMGWPVHLVVLAVTVGGVEFAIGVAATMAQPPAASRAGLVTQDVKQPDLINEMALLKEGDYLRIIVRLKDQMSPQARAEAMAKADEDRNPRKLLVAALQSHAKRTQKPIIDKMEKLRTAQAIRKIRPLWISNVICMEARREAIEKIAQIEGIEYIKQDVPRLTLQDTSWGVTKTNADDVWALPTPYDGSGVVVAVLDSGMDLTHTDLVKRLWINPGEDIDHDGKFTSADINGKDDDGNGYIDDVVGWDFGNDDNDPNDWHGHGTHVSGTIAGDGTGGTKTGVAPGAKLMVLGYSATFTNGQAEAWGGMEYALANGANVVSFSSGWADSSSPDYATWRQNTDTLTDGGVLFCVAAGNCFPHIPAPGDVMIPARCPRALAVGATDDTDTIADFSALGPTSWQNVAGYNDYIYPPGLLKPDLSGPGVSVLSTKNGGGYIDTPIWSGTSMATPHVSGVAALLLQKNPALRPHELAFLLRETSVDLGSSGPDNVYGYGRVDALAAVNYAYDTKATYDLSVTGTSAVWTTTDIWVDNNDDGTPDDPVANVNNHLYARIRNLGGRAAGNVEVKFYYADVGTLGTSGFDPNNDGDPADGNFDYVDSYFVPVVGPSGSSQHEAVAVVNWKVPVPTTDHWCVGIGIVAPNPPNDPEIQKANNHAFRNFFHIVLTAHQVYPFRFFVHPEPREPRAPFDLELIRKGLPKEFEVELAIDRGVAEKWFQHATGLEPIKDVDLKNLPRDKGVALQRGEPILQRARLKGERGALKEVAVPQGKPLLVTVLIRAPDLKTGARLKQDKEHPHLLVINALNAKGVFGGLAIDVDFDDGRRPQQESLRDQTQVFRIKIEDGDEAGLLAQQLKVQPIRVENGMLYYYGSEEINRRLAEIGYQPVLVDADQFAFRIVRIRPFGSAKELRESGARLLLQEKDYWIVRVNTIQTHLLKRLGYHIDESPPGELRPRWVRVSVGSRQEIQKVAPLMSDVFSEEFAQGRTEVYGTAWDDMIDDLRQRGYTVDILPRKGE